jgi:hypothetical protein
LAVEIDMKNKTFKCIICQEGGHITAKSFSINEALLQLIEKQPKEIYRGVKAEKLKNNLDNLET